MSAALIHHLTHPGELTASAVVCGDPSAAVATWDVQRVTCPACKPASRCVRQAGSLSERALQAAVTAALTRAGWLTYHVWGPHARRSPDGWPDLVCLRGDRCLVAELKSATGLLTPAQQTWLAAWRRIVGAEVYVWRPEDLERALEVLR